MSLTPQQRYYQRNKEIVLKRSREHSLKTKYGVSIAEYERRVEAQGGRCAICFTDVPGTKKQYWLVDHNHSTGQVRGLLCDNCNKGLGHFRDNPLFLASAIEYLKAEHGA
jgi:hypothetical protein